MSAFYLQDGVPNNPQGWQESRLFIDDRLHHGCTLVDTIVADDWCDARADVPG